MTVLILAREIEPQVDRMVEELAARDVPVFRSDLAAFPQMLRLDARLDTRPLRLASEWPGCCAVWMRCG